MTTDVALATAGRALGGSKTKPKAAGVTAAVEVIGPTEARYLLRLNTHNRNIRQDRIVTMTRDMVAGKWALNGETIKVSVTDRLLDGQHRLLAVIEARKMIAMTVVRGLPDSAQDTMDLGAKRRLSDVLTLSGSPDASNLAAAVRMAWYLQKYGRPKEFGVNPSLPELQDWLAANPDIAASCRTVGSPARKGVIRYTPSAASALHYLMAQLDSDAADAFWDGLINGGGSQGDPVFMLRESLLRDLSVARRASIAQRVAITIKAWNAYREGRKVSNLGWRATGPSAEPYPALK